MGPLALLLLLAVLQGLTEFLPVSSSGHLVLARELLDDGSLPRDASIEILLHLGTLAAVLVHYRRQALGLAAGALGRGPAPGAERRLLLLLAIGTLPLLPLALVRRDLESVLFEGTLLPSAALLVTGLVLALSRRWTGGGAALADLRIAGALCIGIAQAAAVVPGISRSGMTIVAGLALGLGVEAAATFSFLLAIPAIAGAGILKLPDALAAEAGSAWSHLLLGFLAAALVGYVAIGILLRIARARRLSWFAPYCWALGAVGLAATLLQ